MWRPQSTPQFFYPSVSQYMPMPYPQESPPVPGPSQVPFSGDPVQFSGPLPGPPQVHFSGYEGGYRGHYPAPNSSSGGASSSFSGLPNQGFPTAFFVAYAPSPSHGPISSTTGPSSSSSCCRHRENLGVDTMAETWSCIPNLLIWMIMKRLLFIDNLHLSAVCKHWLNAFHNFPKEQIPAMSCSNFPWLMITKDHRGSEREFFSPWTKTKITVDLPEFANTIVIQSKNGWVLLLPCHCCKQVPRVFLYLIDNYGRVLRFNTIDFTMTNGFMGEKVDQFGVEEKAWAFFKYRFSKATWEALDDDDIQRKSWFLSNCGAKFSSAVEGTAVEKIHFLSRDSKQNSGSDSTDEDTSKYFGLEDISDDRGIEPSSSRTNGAVSDEAVPETESSSPVKDLRSYGRALRFNTIDFTMTNGFMGAEVNKFGTEDRDTYFLQCNKEVIRVSSTGLIPYGRFCMYGFTKTAWGFYKYNFTKAAWEALDEDEIQGKSWFLSNCGAKISSAADGTLVKKVHFLSKLKRKGVTVSAILVRKEQFGSIWRDQSQHPFRSLLFI
ncbi:hypothetical protein RHSIM_Rhsim05G0023300 [Rhododendron simsii]|uniref:F-box domain-containing protein n=1 Tax=Rhododendron simsii TaxID=118357 RepID=A0A834GZG0_RHOSS|nr:hypothetical protein RHSIM_Rhsim05G0023300 [Rhododendron simsii]